MRRPQGAMAGRKEDLTAGTLMSEAGVPPKRAQEILGHADVRTTLSIYTHAMRRKHDASADKMAENRRSRSVGNKWLRTKRTIRANWLISLAPRVGIEPTTNGLTVRRSTAELPRNTR